MMLTKKRIKEIAGMMTSKDGGAFPCHKTLDYSGDGDGLYRETSQHCAGALIFAEKNGNSTQMMRIAERLGMYDAAVLMANQENVDMVFDSISEMKKAIAI